MITQEQYRKFLEKRKQGVCINIAAMRSGMSEKPAQFKLIFYAQNKLTLTVNIFNQNLQRLFQVFLLFFSCSFHGRYLWRFSLRPVL